MEEFAEALKSADITNLIPTIIESDVIEGARAALVAEQVCHVDRRLIGQAGITIRIPKASQLDASTRADEDTQMSTSDKTITYVDVTVDTEAYAAVSLTRKLLEDQPDIDWIRLHFRNMGVAIREKIDSDIISAMVSGAHASTDGASLDWDNIIDAVKVLWANKFKGPFIGLCNPAQKASLLKSTKFIDSVVYRDTTDIMNGEIGTVADVRFLSSTQVPVSTIIITIAPNSPDGASTWIAYKRDITVEQDDQPDYQRTNWYATARYGVKVVQPSAIVTVTGCT